MTPPIGSINSFNDLFKRDNTKQTTPCIYPSSFDEYLKNHTGKKMTKTEYTVALEKASNKIKADNTPANAVKSWVNGIKKDSKEGKIGERIANNPVTKGTALLLGGLTSCTPIKNDMDIVALDYTDPIATGPVSKCSLDLIRKLGAPIVSSITPIQKFGYEDPKTDTKCEYKIDKEKSTPDKIMYNGTLTDKKTGQITSLRCSLTQAADGGLTIEESKKESASDSDWAPYKKAEYKVDDKGRVAKYEDGKYICDYLYSNGEGTSTLHAFYPDGSRQELNNFVATQVTNK